MQAAAALPGFAGGPFVNYGRNRVAETARLLETKTDRNNLIELSAPLPNSTC